MAEEELFALRISSNNFFAISVRVEGKENKQGKRGDSGISRTKKVVEGDRELHKEEEGGELVGYLHFFEQR